MGPITRSGARCGDGTVTITSRPVTQRPRRPSVADMRRLLGSLAVMAVLVLSGCTMGGAGGADSGGESAAVAEDAAGGGDGFAAAGTDAATVVADQDLAFVTTGSVSMVVADPSDAAEDAALIVELAGGHVEERVESGGAPEEGETARLTVRIPSSEVTRTLADLKKLGEVRDTTLTNTEVTDQVTDLAARIRALEISIGRLQDLLGRAGTIGDIVEAERILTERQSQLEVLLSQQAALAEDVAMATFHLELWTEETAQIQEAPAGFWAGLVAGWTALLATLTGALQLLGVLLPWLLFAGLLLAVALPVRRWIKRRPVATTPPAASSPEPQGTPSA